MGTGANSHNMHSNACKIRKQMEKIESSLKYDHLSCPARDFKHSSLSEIQGHYDHSNESHCAELYSFNTGSNAEQHELSGCYFLVEH